MIPDHDSPTWGYIRYEYEQTDRPLHEICASYRISEGTLRDRVRRWNWMPRRAPVPKDGPEAVKPPDLEAVLAEIRAAKARGEFDAALNADRIHAPHDVTPDFPSTPSDPPCLPALGVEQHALGDAALDHHEDARHQDRAVRQYQEDVRGEEGGDLIRSAFSAAG